MNADAIVKALRCCNVPSGRACSECTYHEVGEECRTKRNKDAADVIIELAKENSILRTEVQVMIASKLREIPQYENTATRIAAETEMWRMVALREKQLEDANDRLYTENARLREIITDGVKLAKEELAKQIKADTVQKMKNKLTDRDEFSTRADYDGIYYIDHACWVNQVAEEILGEE